MSSRQRLVLLAIAAVVLVGGIALASSTGDEDEPGSETTAQQQTVETTGPGETVEEPPPGPRVETIRIKDGKPAGEVRTLRYERGEVIRLRFSSNAPGEVHIHGYDNEFPVSPSGARVIRFKADLEGIFEVEEHGTGELLAKLEIRPK